MLLDVAEFVRIWTLVTAWQDRPKSHDFGYEKDYFWLIT